MSLLEEFLRGLHPSSTVLCKGHASVMGQTVEAVLVRNLYCQEIVWGPFSVERGKFKGKIANNANTEGVVWHARDP